MKSLIYIVVLMIGVVAGGHCARAQIVLAEQVFDLLTNPDVDGDVAFITRQEGELLSGTALPNAGSMNVDGPGLGFSSTYFSYANSAPEFRGPITNGEEDNGDRIGVNSQTGNFLPRVSADGFAIGTDFLSERRDWNFVFNDIDGRIDLVFDPVDTTGFGNRIFSMNYWINFTQYEEADSLVVSISDGTNSFELLNLDAAGLNEQRSRTIWHELTQDLEILGLDNGITVGDMITVTISASTRSNVENIVVDNIKIAGGASPVQTSQITEIFHSVTNPNTGVTYVIGQVETDPLLFGGAPIRIESFDADCNFLNSVLVNGLGGSFARVALGADRVYALVNSSQGVVSFDLDLNDRQNSVPNLNGGPNVTVSALEVVNFDGEDQIYIGGGVGTALPSMRGFVTRIDQSDLLTGVWTRQGLDINKVDGIGVSETFGVFVIGNDRRIFDTVAPIIFNYDADQGDLLGVLRTPFIGGSANGLAIGEDSLGEDAVIFFGYTRGQTGVIPLLGEENNSDAFIASFTAQDFGSEPIFCVSTFGSSEDDTAVDIAFDQASNIYVIGTTNGLFAPPSFGRDDVFVAQFDPGINLIGQRQLGTTTTDRGRSIGIFPSVGGFPIIVGAVNSAGDFDNNGSENGNNGGDNGGVPFGRPIVNQGHLFKISSIGLPAPNGFFEPTKTGEPLVLLGDANNDGVLDFGDLNAFIALFLNGQYSSNADINQDGALDFADIPLFIALLLNF